MPVRLRIVSVLLALTLFFGAFSTVHAVSNFSENQPIVSVLNPSRPDKTVLNATVDVIDPTPQNNPKGAKYPGLRTTGQLVVYTPLYGSSTQTSGFGAEAIVDNDIVEAIGTSNSTIPFNGFVISGQGQLGQWIQRVIKPGAKVTLDVDARTLTIQTTPAVYVRQLEGVLARIPNTVEGPGQEQAKLCVAQLQQVSGGGLNDAFMSQYQQCQALANQAYLQSVQNNPDAFRGVWVRPTEQSENQIRQAVAELKAANIQHIFLETYFEGQTLYPSQVMAEYNLPSQYVRFENLDPFQTWIKVAHEAGMKVHAWVEVFYAGNQKSVLEPYGPVLDRYPEWANVQRLNLKEGHPVASYIEAGHFFLDPANPEVRQFLQRLILEIASQYDIDGINLDYIRYPSSQPASHPSYLASTWGYTQAARSAFTAMLADEVRASHARQVEALKKEGKTIPSSDIEAWISKTAPSWDPIKLTPSNPLWTRWVQWRMSQVSTFVKDIAEQVHQQKPNLLVSAVVFPHPDPQNPIKLQDWPTWVENGWVQALTPIGLDPTVEGMYEDSLAIKKLAQDKVPVYIGVFGMYNRLTPLDFVGQIDAVFRAGLPGVVLFERAKLNDDYKQALLQGAFKR